MSIDFNKIPEYELFKDLTTLDSVMGRGVIDITAKPKYFNAEERKEVFFKMMNHFKDNGFRELYEEYVNILKHKSYSNMDSIYTYNNFIFNHPFVVMLYMFIDQGLLTRDLEVNPDMKLVGLGEKVLEYSQLKNMNISEGVIFSDGALMPIKSNEAHKLAALWMFLNGKKLSKAIRYTTDCIHPEPIYSSMSEYANLPKDIISITEPQAIAIYNIYKLQASKSCNRVSFEQVLENSQNLCITSDGEPNVRYANAKMLERALGSEVFNARDILQDLKSKSYLV